MYLLGSRKALESQSQKIAEDEKKMMAEVDWMNLNAVGRLHDSIREQFGKDSES